MSPTVQAALDRLAVGIVPDMIELTEIAAEVRRLEQDAKRLDFIISLFAKQGSIDGCDFCTMDRAEIEAARALEGGRP
jgi:hypothetical protein